LDAPTVPYRLIAGSSTPGSGEVGRVYQPLAVERREIRLLEVELLHNCFPVRCKLVTVSLDDDPEYVAVSYVWGDPSDTETLFVGTEPVNVRRNLWSAIRRFREDARVAYEAQGEMSSDRAIRIWADAICINQADDPEKNVQVKLMGDIYKGAKAVAAWLGNRVNDTLAIAALRIIVGYMRYNDNSPN
jgi:hypothetical protein